MIDADTFLAALPSPSTAATALDDLLALIGITEFAMFTARAKDGGGYRASVALAVCPGTTFTADGADFDEACGNAFAAAAYGLATGLQDLSALLGPDYFDPRPA
jgi:hypothetical protein